MNCLNLTTNVTAPFLEGSAISANFALMKLFEKKIGRIIDMVFCVAFMPLILVLGPTNYWYTYWPSFAYLLTACLYGYYFAIRFLNVPKLFVERKYWAIAAIIAALIACNYLLTLYPLPEVRFNEPSLTLLYNNIRSSSQSMGVWLMFSIVMAYALSMSFIRELYQQLLLKREFELRKNTAELAVYKAQINPHFLFNTLNSLYSMLIGTSERAENAFIKFIDLVKYTYTSVDNETVALRDEINYIRNYIDLQALRLNGHTKVEWHCEVDDEQQRIPPMIMITFLENVFKYGVSANRDCVISLRLTLREGQLEFRTVNDVIRHVDEFRTEAPVGIENCRARLNSLFPGRYRLTVDEKNGKFEVDLKINLT